MSKSVVSRLFYGSLLGMLAAIVLGIAALGIAIGTRSLVWEDDEVVGIRSGYGWALIVVGAVAVLFFAVAMVAQFVAWVGALINTAPLQNKAWFVVLLVSGVLGFGLIPLLVYVLSETNSGEARPTSPAPVRQTA